MRLDSYWHTLLIHFFVCNEYQLEVRAHHKELMNYAIQ
jgi:hypothetical protein